MSRALKPCGTDAAYARHLRHGEQACDPCLEANRVASLARRHGNAAYMERHRQRSAAHSRAARRLMAEYPARFRELCNEEYRKIREAS